MSSEDSSDYDQINKSSEKEEKKIIEKSIIIPLIKKLLDKDREIQNPDCNEEIYFEKFLSKLKEKLKKIWKEEMKAKNKDKKK